MYDSTDIQKEMHNAWIVNKYKMKYGELVQRHNTACCLCFFRQYIEQ